MQARVRLAVWGGLVAALGVSACTTTEPATEVIVVVRADGAVTRAASRLTVMVRGYAPGSAVATTMQDTAFAPPSFPRRIAIVPAADDAARTFSIEVRALATPATGGEILLSTARARAGFLSHRTTEVSLLLVAGCSCPPRQTCNAEGRCVDESVNPDGGTPLDSGAAQDAGTDAAVPVTCVGDGGCDDGDLCTTGDACAAGLCRGVSMRCDDGDACNGTETCAAGSCQPGLALACDDSIPCTVDSCMSGECRHMATDGDCTVLPLGRCDPSAGCVYPGGCAACTDTPCAVAECNGDTCTYTPRCNDANPCTRDDCTSGACNFVPITGSCDDGNLCTDFDRCVRGACSGLTVECGILDSCRIGACDSESGMCVPINVSDGAHCPLYDNLCVLRSECRSGECQALAVMSVCPDGSTCEAVTGCP